MKLTFTRMMILSLLLLGGQTLLAQFTLTGSITDAGSGEPLIGATILVDGTTTGSVTDFEGKYTIEIPGNSAKLIFSYTGYQSQEIDVTSATTTLDLAMESGSEQLSEVVVTGYGSTRKEALTGAVTSLRSDKLEQVPLSSVEQTLQGNVAGLQAVMANGQPGANASIRIRGQGSISASSEPLYVIDGIPIASGNLTSNAESSNPIATINPNDIETVTVLKDASATAIYGSRAANGVILITTKSGKSGKPKIDLRTQVGYNDWAVKESNRLRGLTAEEYSRLYIEGWVNRGETVEQAIDRFNGHYPDPLTGQPAVDLTPNGSGGVNVGTIRVDTRWIDELSRQGLNQSYDLSVSGGNDIVTYYASGSYFSQEAPIIYSELDRYSSRLNLSVNASPKLKISNNLNISRTSQQGMNDATRWANPLYNGYLLAPTIPVRDPTGQFYGDHKSFFMGGNNPIGSLSGDDNQEWTMTRIIDNVTGSYEILEGLIFKTAWGIDLLNYKEFYYRNGRYGDGRNTNGFGSELTRDVVNWIGTQTLNYGTSLGGSHNLDFLLGYEVQKSSTRSAYGSAEEYPPNPDLRTLANAANPSSVWSNLSEFSFESLFAQASYNFNYKYYLSGSVRRDGSSRFGTENRYGTFWSVGASWRLDQEDFIQNSNFINELKLRASYGVTGNAGIGNYEAIPTFGFSGFEYDGKPGGGPSNIGNINLTWEQSKAFNVGLDFAILGRVSGIIEYFNRESDNLLLDVPISRTTGFGTLTQNFGAMENRGLELTLDVNILNQEDVQLNIGGNITFITNEITKLNEDFIDGTKKRIQGEDFQTFWLYDWVGVNPDDGAPIWYTDENRSEQTSTASDAERFAVGPTATPDFFGGMNINLGVKGLYLDAQFTYSWNNYIYDNTAWVLQGDGRFTPRSQTNKVLDRWQNPGDVTDVPKFAWGNTSSSNLRPSSRYLFDGTYIRLRNATLGYNIPSSITDKLKLRNARIYARATNLWTWTRDEDLYLDPEAAFSGVIDSPVPNLKTISFGLDIGL